MRRPGDLSALCALKPAVLGCIRQNDSGWTPGPQAPLLQCIDANAFLAQSPNDVEGRKGTSRAEAEGGKVVLVRGMGVMGMGNR